LTTVAKSLLKETFERDEVLTWGGGNLL